MRAVPILSIQFFCISTVFCTKNDPSIVVVGAGPAGIAASTRLLENGFKNVTILEAEPRIGGRIHSVKFGDAFVDLGAQWCHGEKDNAVFDLVKDFNILRHTTTSKKIFHSSGHAIDDAFSQELFDIMDSVYTADGNRFVPDSVTVGDYCRQNFNRTIHDKYGTDREKLDLAMSAMEFFQHRVLGYEGSFSWYEPAAKNDYRDCEGDLQLNWNGLGYKTILEVMMRKYPYKKRQLPIDRQIFLNKQVKKILWNENQKKKAVSVLCSDGTSYSADHVIFTPSVGVLKDKAYGMFQPRLSDVKHRAIGETGFGAVMKVAMHFPKQWWGNTTGFNFMWSKADKWAVLNDRPRDPKWLGRSWITYLYTVEGTEHNSKVLMAWFTGNFVPVIEQLSDEMLINGIHYVLKKFLHQDYQVSPPDKIIRSQWYSNPSFRGSYSFQTIKCKRGHGTTSENILAMPLVNIENRPIVQFAGEATHPYYFSTVHGAIETGYREADVLIKLYRKHS